jgi:hypothetical protein
MYNPNLEKKLIVVNIAQALIDYASIQADIDQSKIQAAEYVVQLVDLKRLIGQTNVTRCIDPISLDNPPPTADVELRELILPAVAFFTYAKLLKLYPGTFTDSGYIIEKEASDKNVTTQVSNDYYATAESLMEDVFAFLKSENAQDKSVKPENMTPSIRVFGGQEHRATN